MENQMDYSQTKAVLDDLVERGGLVEFTNREGEPMWGFPPTEHEHNWINPDVRANKTELRAAVLDGEPITIQWRCSVPGCSERYETEATLQREDQING
jgi:hypothetical protein